MLPRSWRGSQAGADLERLCRLHGDLHRCDNDLYLRPSAHPTRAAAQSPAHAGCEARPGVQHRGQLQHQHQLAELWRRKHHELPLSDGGIGVPQFRLAGHRDCNRGGAGARDRALVEHNRRQFLARPHPPDPLPVHSRGADLLGVYDVSGHSPEFPALHRSQDCRRRNPDHRARPHGVTDGYQDAGHEWWWLLERERGPSLREPDAAVQLRSDRSLHRDLQRADLLPRPHGEESAPRLGSVGEHVWHADGWHFGLLVGRSARQPAFARPWCGSVLRQHGGQRSSFWHR